MRKLVLFFLLFPFIGNVQVKSETYLHDLYKAKYNSALFAQTEAIKNSKRDNILAKINALPEKAKQEIIRQADAALNLPWPLLTFSQFNEFKTIGNRVNYEGNYFARRSKLTTLIIGELVSQKGKYLPELINGLGLVLEESTWALPAHMSLQKAGNGLPDANEPIIDLFVSQTAMILSYTKLLLANQLDQVSPELTKRIDFELKKRVFEPYLARDDFWWMGFAKTKRMNNWNIFINTNVLVTTLLAQDNPKLREAIVEKTVKSVDFFLAAYPEDGGCDEGPSYWAMAGGALIEYIDLLSVFSAQQLDFSKSPLIHNIGTYIYKVHIDGNYFVNFADAAVANAQDASRIYKFGKLFNDQQLLSFAAYVMQVNNGEERFDMGNIQGFVTSLELRDEFKNIKPVAPQPLQAWLPAVQILTARLREGSGTGLFFAAKGGNNAESHNHNDIGNFILYKDGTPIVVDAGVGVYTKQTFSAERYNLWYMQSGWHNCPTINGVDQQAGASFKATAIKYNQKGELVNLAMDLAQAYPPQASVLSWNRAFLFDRTNAKLTLTEDYRLKTFKEASTLNFLVNGTVTSAANGKLQLTTKNGKSITLIYDPLQFDYVVEVKKIDDNRLAASWHNDLVRLMLKRKSNALNGKYQIEFR